MDSKANDVWRTLKSNGFGKYACSIGGFFPLFFFFSVINEDSKEALENFK
jgi:hypothetical protein